MSGTKYLDFWARHQVHKNVFKIVYVMKPIFCVFLLQPNKLECIQQVVLAYMYFDYAENTC